MEDDTLKSIPLGQLMEMRKNGREIRGDRVSAKEVKIPKHGKKDKHAPQEVSSKIRVRRHKAVDVSTQVRDPRFDSLSGKLNYDLYRKSYKWIEEKQENEAKELQEQMFKEGDDSEKRRIQADMTRIMQQNISRKRRDRAALERKREFMKSEKEAVSKGKKPFFLKKRVLREAELKDRFDSLEKKGRVNKYMEKKRKRNAQRDRANMPAVRGAE
ncbi:hypothetical protein WA577_003664 [Blastocystis sp. JDR]